MTMSNPLEAIGAAARSGNFPLTETLCRAALKDMPGREDVLFFLALSLQFQGRTVEAIGPYAELTRLAPSNSTHWANYGTALSELGRGEEAEQAFAEAIRLDPRNPGPHLNLGLLLMRRRDFLAAREKLLDAVDADPNLPVARIHAAVACSHCQDFDRAEKLLKPWREWMPLNDPGLQLDLADTLLLLSDGTAAQALLEDLVRVAPRHLNARTRLASMYERMNRIDDAERVLDSAVEAGLVVDADGERAVEHVRAAIAVRRKDYARAREILEHSAPRHPEDAPFHFHLASVYDKLGETDLAMQALRMAHAIKVEQVRRISPEDFEPDAPPAPIAVPNVTAADYASWPSFAAPDARNSPIFIVGFPRSGTTLLEQMLDAHPGLQSMDENPFFNRLADTLKRHDSRILGSLDVLRQYDVDELRKQYLLMVSEKIRRRWDAQLVDKNPLNMLWLPFIHRLYPNAKYILAIRHPCDVLLSCYMQNFRASILLTASATLERLAQAYVDVMQLWLKHVEVFRPSVFVSRYEDVVADTVGQTRRLAAFLELDDPSPMLRFDRHARDKGYIGTPSYSQVIEPVNTKGLNRWVKYRPYFEKALPILEPMLRHWGYSADPDV
jgi:Flp pilus assembly protein TadD